MTCLTVILSALAVIALSGFISCFLPAGSNAAQRLTAGFFVTGSLAGFAGTACAFAQPAPLALSIGWSIPWGRFSVSADPLSCLFLFIIFSVPALASVYGLEYWKQSAHRGNGRKLGLFFGLLVGGMGLVVISRDAILFLIAWEIMALSAFFALTTEDDIAEVRRVGWIYLVATHMGTLTLFVLFALWRRATGSFDLSAAQGLSPAGEGAFTSRLLLFMGLSSMAVAGVFMVRQNDIKRLLAYSSVEHMGILVLGLGIGGPALAGTLFHLVANAMTKGILFLSAGNIQRAYASKNTGFVTGALRRLPLSGGLFLTGFIAITGSPPFAPFISEFSILSGAFSEGLYAVGACFAIFLLVVFIGMGSTVLRVVFGPEPAASGSASGGAASGAQPRYRDTFLTVAPSFAFLAIVLALGVWLPAPLGELFASAARFLENVR